ncbi:hypothetical protein CHLNCDRAFT_24474, partial [Chlorella variabilis]
PQIRDWAYALYEIWGRLARQLSPEVSQNPELYTMLPVPNPFVVPGARFREIYYWDSFWVLKGLIASNLTTLAQARDACCQLPGSCPQAASPLSCIRTYYLNRSQPPLFSEMVRIVWEATGNRALLSDAMPALLREHAFWTSPPKQARPCCLPGCTTRPCILHSSHATLLLLPLQVVAVAGDGKQYNVSRYFANWQQPRPESYICLRLRLSCTARPHEKAETWPQLYSNPCPAGWDFSTRWFRDGRSLATVRTTSILPADLNGFLLQMEANIADFAAELGCSEVEQQFRQLAMDRRDALNTLFWNNSTAQWHDLICNPQQGEGTAAGTSAPTGQAIFASNFIPLFAGAAGPGSEQASGRSWALNASGLIGVGGVAVSLTESGQQWDWPNVWPPITSMLIDGADKFGGELGAVLSRQLTASYLGTVLATWEDTGRMFEKFNVETLGVPGGGGEYEVVDGFGWTNGVVLDLLNRFGGE